MAESFGTGAAYLTKDNIVRPSGPVAASEAAVAVEGLADLNARATGAYLGDNSYTAESIPTADGPRTG